MATFPVWAHMAFPVCVHRERGRQADRKADRKTDGELTLSLSLKALIPNTVTVGLGLQH